MQKAPSLVVAQRAIRSQVCPVCTQRPPGSEKLGPDTPRTCEPQCSVFHHLPKMLEVVAKTQSPTLGAYEKAALENICQTCGQSPTSGDFCAERSLVECPLSRQMGAVVETLEKVLATQRGK
jgi:hypothetical protein